MFARLLPALDLSGRNVDGPSKRRDSANGRPEGPEDDSRDGGVRTGGSTYQLQVTGRAGVPANATAVNLNLAAVNPFCAARPG